jgi:hypothetical protein
VVAVSSLREAQPSLHDIDLRNVYLEMKIGVIKGVHVVAVERLASRPVIGFIFSDLNSYVDASATTLDLGASFLHPYLPSLTLHRPQFMLVRLSVDCSPIPPTVPNIPSIEGDEIDVAPGLELRMQKPKLQVASTDLKSMC